MGDWGQLLHGDITSHAFEVRNGGDTPLLISKVLVSCGCARTQFDETIPPGGKGKVTVWIDTATLFPSPEIYEKSATIISNDPARPRLELKMRGRVAPLIELDPRLVSLAGPTGAPLEMAVMVSVAEGLRAVVRGASTRHGNAEATVEEVEPGTTYRIHLKAAAASEPRMLPDALEITVLANGKERVLPFPMEVRHRGWIEFQPGQRIVFGRRDTSTLREGSPPIKKEVAVHTPVEGYSFEITGVTLEGAPPGAFETALHVEEKGKRYRIEIRLLKRLQARIVQAKLMITTDDPARPRFEIAVIAHFAP